MGATRNSDFESSTVRVIRKEPGTSSTREGVSQNRKIPKSMIFQVSLADVLRKSAKQSQKAITDWMMGGILDGPNGQRNPQPSSSLLGGKTHKKIWLEMDDL